MMHSGIGPSQVNALLSSLNIPTVSTRTLQNRQNELGTVMEKVAEDTKRSSLHEEIQATLELCIHADKILVQYISLNKIGFIFV